jgi:hypothetical protein
MKESACGMNAAIVERRPGIDNATSRQYRRKDPTGNRGLSCGAFV